ncbi:hypothetical protein ACOSQ3_030540 [Xanthoceras sorbifolium]
MGEVHYNKVLNNNEEAKWIKHYSSCHQILLVGEGDFSFAACLAKAFGTASNIIATSLDSKATSNLKELQDLGCTIVHGVDASTMNQHPQLINFKSFDRIVFNFPHAGFFWKEHNFIQISSHQSLVRGFLRSTRDMLKDNGEAHVTHKTAHPFNRWEIEKLADEVGLRSVGKVLFSTRDYPGYENKRGDGSRCDETFPVGACCTFKFFQTMID